MKEVYLLNRGDSLDKIKYEFKEASNIELAEDKIFGYKYATIDKGLDDVIIVYNYLPVYDYKVKPNESLLDIVSRGFKTDVVSVSSGDEIILTKPKSIRYVVSPLETLQDIAFKFGITTSDIIQNNDLKTEKLFVGQILWI